MAPGHSSIREVAKVRSKTPGEGENVMGTEKNQKSVGTTLPLVCVGHCAEASIPFLDGTIAYINCPPQFFQLNQCVSLLWFYILTKNLDF